MKKKDQCPYFQERAISTHYSRRIDFCNSDPEQRFPRGSIKPKILKCPECGRKVKQRVGFCHDGCCVLYWMPPHKRKGWFQKGKLSRNTKGLRRR